MPWCAAVRAPGRAPEVSVEVHLANGLPSFSIVGLPDLEVRESRERVRAALQNGGFDFPARRIKGLAPADLPKESGRFDLPIALGILVASGQIPAGALLHREFAGEFSLTGALRPMRGAFAMACEAARQYAQAARSGAALDHACIRDSDARMPEIYLPLGSAAEMPLMPGYRYIRGRRFALFVCTPGRFYRWPSYAHARRGARFTGAQAGTVARSRRCNRPSWRAAPAIPCWPPACPAFWRQ